MNNRQSSESEAVNTEEVADHPMVDMPAVGERLRRWRQAHHLTQAALAQRAGVDAMVVSRLEGGHKARLEVESAARLASAFGLTLDQFCGLAEEPEIVVKPIWAPLHDGRPAWLQSSTNWRRMLAHILAWQQRGATPQGIADSLNAWGIPTENGRGKWGPRIVASYRRRDVPKGQKARREFLKAYGPAEH
jgi:transcriptional regulator with XRE-family HTH domain